MTTHRTPKEVNAALALLEGWFFCKATENIRAFWYKHGARLSHPPDYCGDWAHIGPKFKELIMAAGDVTLRRGIEGTDERAFVLHSSSLDLYEDGDEPEEAIARAVLAWKETKC